jgi:hypothetical protein
MRVTINIDGQILRKIKAIQQREGRSMGAVISELLADAIVQRRGPVARAPFRWTSRPMKALVDLADKEAVCATLDGDQP